MATDCPCAGCCAIRHAIRHKLRQLERWPFRTALRAEIVSLRDSLKTAHSPN